MKLKYLAKEYASKYPDYGDVFVAKESFTTGFKTAFKTVNEQLQNEIDKLEQYPMMNERIFALKLYIKKMNEILKESID